MAGIVSCLTQPAKVAVTWIGEQIFQQFTFLWCFTTNINSLKEEEKRLDRANKSLQSRVDEATADVKVIDLDVVDWLEKTKDIQDETSKILSEAESGHLKVGDRFSLSKRAKKMTDRAKNHREKNISAISHSGPPPATLTVPGGMTDKFESRKIIEDAIMSTLTDRRGVNMIGIYGMGGLGKTTMAENIRNRVLKENVFQEVAMTTVSQQVGKSKIQVEIGGQLGLDLKAETSLQGRVQKLHARLSGTKRTLVILDDVWEEIKLKELGIPCDSEWCTILITSRNKDALSAMGREVEKKIFGMKILSEDEAWCLFREGAGTCMDDPNLNSIAKQVVKECKGLPIALKTVSLALRDKNTASIWNAALRDLRQCDADIPNYIKEVYTPLKWSYDFLDSERAKFIFLLCCLFPEDSNIPLEKLTYFCMGLGIFGRIRNLEDARNKTCSLTDNLKSRSLLLDGYNENHVRMHDVVRDVCTFIAKQKGYIGGNDCTWISSSQFDGERIELLKSRFPNLRLLSLSSADNFGFSSASLKGIKDLYVLRIENNWGLTSLPRTTHSLMNLKTLLLDSCYKLKSISVVGKLRNLEILICRDCGSIEGLPAEMKGFRLKLLDLTSCGKLRSIGRGIISSLVGLEELKMLGSFKKWEDREERENAGLKELEALTNLRCLEIQIEDPALAAKNMHLSSKLKRYNIMIGENVYSTAVDLHHKRMNIRLERHSCLGDWMMKLLRDTEGLSLRRNGANNVGLAKCQNIKSLELRECETMKSISVPHFSNLSSISIEECHGLCNLGQLSIAGKNCLPQFEQLHVRKCQKMEYVFLWNEESGSHQITKVFSKLKVLELVSLPNLETFYRGIEGIEFPLLREMKIEECPKMKITSSSADIDDHSLHLFCKSQKVSFDTSLEVLGMNHNPFCGREFPSSLFNGLKVLTINKYEGSISLFKLSMASKLVSLTGLRIENCKEMIRVIEDEEQQERILIFPKMEKLWLEGLPKLARFCEWKCDVEFPSLTNVFMCYCHNMKSFSMGSVTAPNLEFMYTEGEYIDDAKELMRAAEILG